jgi:hypothetical protein
MFDWPMLSKTAIASLLVGIGFSMWVGPSTRSGLVFLILFVSALVFLAFAAIGLGLRFILRRRRQAVAGRDQTPVPFLSIRRKDR